MNAYRLTNASATALLLFSAVIGTASAEPHHHGPGMSHATVFDHRYNHDHYYPARGYAVHQLPVGAYATHYGGAPYYFNRGAWYRPYGPRFVVVAPPIGIGLSVLPPFYTTVRFGGVPYYYANNAYYVWRPDQQLYQVTTPPAEPDSGTTTAPNSQDLFVYPKNGQSQQQQSADRYDCHSWAVQQSGFDPMQPLGGVSESQAKSKRADYQRAETACLEARNYTVK
jgi:hypothetical protein